MVTPEDAEAERDRLRAALEVIEDALAHVVRVQAAEPSLAAERALSALTAARRALATPRPVPTWLRIYVTVGQYEDGAPGELFIKADKQGALASGAFDAVAIAISIGLQHGVPLEQYTAKLKGMTFEPAGLTGDPEFPTARSVLDLIGRWLEVKFVARAPAAASGDLVVADATQGDAEEDAPGITKALDSGEPTRQGDRGKRGKGNR
jgi:hypothetical protein